MKILSTQIEINASAERVWSLLTDFASFPSWNPFITLATGRAEKDARLNLFIKPVGGSGMNIKPTVLKAEPGRELRWLGRLVLPGLVDGEHSFIIEPLGDSRVRLTHQEVFNGVLVPLLMTGSLENGTRQGFEAMNRALKARAEEIQ
jgi:hypothetical protein